MRLTASEGSARCGPAPRTGSRVSGKACPLPVPCIPRTPDRGAPSPLPPWLPFKHTEMVPALGELICHQDPELVRPQVWLSAWCQLAAHSSVFAPAGGTAAGGLCPELQQPRLPRVRPLLSPINRSHSAARQSHPLPWVPGPSQTPVPGTRPARARPRPASVGRPRQPAVCASAGASPARPSSISATTRASWLRTPTRTRPR